MISLKRAQVSIFAILGISILIVSALLFYIYNSDLGQDNEEILEIPSQIQPIRTYIDTCLQNMGREAIIIVSRQGGYYDVPDDSSVIFLLDEVPYYYLNEELIVPTKKFVENEISKYMEDSLNDCVDNFEDFKTQGFDIESGEKQVKTVLVDKTILISLDFPLKIRRGDSYYSINKFATTVNSNLKQILDLATKISEYYTMKQGFICLTCLDELKEDYPFDIDITPLHNFSSSRRDIVIFGIKDNLQLNGEYSFKFAFDYSPIPIASNEVRLKTIPDLTVWIGYTFEYQVQAAGNGLTFSDNTDLFDIDATTGVIKFKPAEEQIGSYLIEITAKDKQGKLDFEVFTINVTGFNNHPKIDYIGYLTGKVGERFFYDVNATDLDGDGIFFTSNTNLFKISIVDGLIIFMPKKEDKGEHTINITAIDSKGGVDIQEMNIFITN